MFCFVFIRPGVSKQPPSPKKPTYKPSNQSLSSSIRSNSESSIPQHIPTNRKSQPPARPAGPAGPAGPATQKPQRISSPSITNSMAKPPPIKSSLGKEMYVCVNPSPTSFINYN